MNELEKMNNFVKEFHEKFGNIDPNTLTGEVKKQYLKAKKMVDGVEQQKGMMDSVLDSFSQFGVDTIKIGSKSFSKVEEQTEKAPEEKPKEYTGGQFDDIMNCDDDKLTK